MPDRIIYALFILGLLVLSFLSGAALTFYEYFPYQVFYKAQLGATAWYETSVKSEEPVLPGVRPGTAPTTRLLRKDWTLKQHQPGVMADSYMLVCPSSHPSGYLISADGKMLHSWSLAPEQTHMLQNHHFEDAYLYANGDLLAAYKGVKEYGDRGIAKLDKDSKVIWQQNGEFHHSLTVGENGNIYALLEPVSNTRPQGAEFINTPFLDDQIVILSPGGKELKRISIIQAFVHSHFAGFLKLIREGRTKGDILHANKVEPLPSRLAKAFPQYRPGDILISMRNINTVAVIDPDLEAVIWARHGVWKHQHDASFMNNGHILLFDNEGYNSKKPASRILEIDGKTGDVLKEYGPDQGLQFVSDVQGKQELMPDGSLLIDASTQERLIDWNEKQGVVWEIYNPAFDFIHCMHSYRKKDVSFMKAPQ